MKNIHATVCVIRCVDCLYEKKSHGVLTEVAHAESEYPNRIMGGANVPDQPMSPTSYLSSCSMDEKSKCLI